MRFIRRNGQSIGEYAILLGIVLGAVFAAQNFVRNRISAKARAGAETYLTELREELKDGVPDITEASHTLGGTSTSQATAAVKDGAGTYTRGSTGTSESTGVNQ